MMSSNNKRFKARCTAHDLPYRLGSIRQDMEAKNIGDEALRKELDELIVDSCELFFRIDNLLNRLRDSENGAV